MTFTHLHHGLNTVEQQIFAIAQKIPAREYYHYSLHVNCLWAEITKFSWITGYLIPSSVSDQEYGIGPICVCVRVSVCEHSHD